MAAGGLAFVPGIEAGLGAAAGHQGAHQPDGDIGAGLPGVDVGVVHHGGGGHFGLCTRHVLRHRPAHAAQLFRRAQFGQRAGYPFDVGGGDHALGARCRGHCQVHPEPARQRAHRRRGLDAGGHGRGGCRGARRRGFIDHVRADLDRAHHGAGVGILARTLEADQRCAQVDDIAGLRKQLVDGAGIRRRDFHDGLGRLH